MGENPFAISGAQSLGPPGTINTIPAGPGYSSAPPATSFLAPNTMKSMGPMPMGSMNAPPPSMGYLPGPQVSMPPMSAPMPAPMPMQASVPQQPQWISNV